MLCLKTEREFEIAEIDAVEAAVVDVVFERSRLIGVEIGLCLRFVLP